MSNNKIKAGHISAIMTIFIWGTTFISTKVLLQDFTPIEILVFRFIIGYIALFCLCPQHVKKGSIKEEIHFMFAGLSGVTLYFLLENIALSYTLATNVGVIISIAPFFTSIFAHLFLENEKLTSSFFVGFIIALIGIILIEINGGVALKLNPFGDMLAILAAVLWAVYSIVMRKISKFQYNTIICTRKVFFYGLIFMVPAIFAFDFRLGLYRFNHVLNLMNILYLGLGASALCFVTWNWSVKILGVVKTSVYIYLVPVITTCASVLILQENITIISIIGIILTLAGLFISDGKKFISFRKKTNNERTRYKKQQLL